MRRLFLRRSPRVVVVAVALACAALLFACASHQQAGASAAEPHDLMVIDSSEIVGRGFANAYVAVSSVRPAWLRAAGPTVQQPVPTTTTRFPTAAQVARATNVSTGVGVFVDGSKQPVGTSYLNSLAVEQVAWLRRLGPSEAMATYGPEWAQGVIIVHLRQ